jgi:hypothetical protein
MPAISHLDCIGRTLIDALDVRTCPVAADDLNTRMISKPSFQSFGRSICQQIDRTATLKVNQNGTIALTFTPSPIVKS